jgi:SAM-dependent methyltransferase
MAACVDCVYLDSQNRQCSVGRKKVLRNCILPIVEGYHKYLSSGHRVLEVGCGAWSPTREYCLQIGAAWEAIDILETYMGKKTLATRIASVEAIPFPDEYFDFVIANQSMEHWEENNVPLQRGLNEIFRVLKTGGVALINVPIHFHGGYRFVRGDIDGIRQLFAPYSSEVRLEKWRSPSDPLPPFYHLRHSYWFSELRNKPAYVLDIQAKKKANISYPRPTPITPFRRIWRSLRYRGILYYLTWGVRRFLKSTSR